MGIEILPPDVNLSDHEFVVVDGNIRFGLDAVKGVGYAAVEAIKAARDEGSGDEAGGGKPFTSLWDFCERVDGRAVNKKAIEALIKCGAFGSTGASRKGMLAVLESAQAAGQKAQLDAQIGQGSIFDLGGFGESAGGGGSAFAAPSHPPIPLEEFERPELLAMEKESIGIFITEHPLKRVRDALRVRGDTLCSDIPDRRDGEWVKVGGMISASKKIKTRTGSTVMFATLDDLDAQVELLVFEKVILAGEAALQTDQIVLVRGTVDHGENGKVCVKVADVTPFNPSEAEIERARDQAAALAAARAPRPLCLRVDAGRLPASVIEELKRIFEDFPGESEVVLEVHTRTGLRRLRFGDGFKVAGRNAALKAELDRVLGPAVLPAVPQPA
jgi:DNA polymerase-3 subunit alpha